jgi:hypothetical protein
VSECENLADSRSRADFFSKTAFRLPEAACDQARGRNFDLSGSEGDGRGRKILAARAIKIYFFEIFKNP